MAESEGRGPQNLTLVGPQADVQFYATHVAQQATRVLVLGCGTGRLALGLSRPGCDVLGVDASARMLEHAEEKRRTLAPEEQARLHFLVADLRSLRLAEKFDAIVAPQNGLSLHASDDDLAALLATVRHHLSPTGSFAFDVANAQSVEGLSATTRRPFAPHLRERQRGERGTDESSGIRRWKVRHLGADELDRLLSKEGFVVTERYGTFEGTPFNDNDNTQIVVAVPGENVQP